MLLSVPAPSVTDLQVGAAPLSSTSASRKPSSRRSSICAPPPAQLPPMMGNPVDQLGAWSSLEQPVMRPPHPAQTLGKFQSLGNLHSLTKLPPHHPTFRPPHPAPPPASMVSGALHPDKRTASLCNIRTVDRLANPTPPARFALQHPAAAPLSSKDGTLSHESPPQGSLIRSASQPSLAGTRKQRSFDLDHIVSVISRDPSVSNLNSMEEEMGVADPAPLLPKPEDSFLDEELQQMVGSVEREEEPFQQMVGSVEGEEESFQQKALAAKSMPALNRPMGAQYSLLENFLMSAPSQVWRGCVCVDVIVWGMIVGTVVGDKRVCVRRSGD